MDEVKIPELVRWSLEEYNDSNAILVDFDGTMTIGGYPNIGEPNESVLEFIRIKRSGGEQVVLWSCRTSMRLCKTPIIQRIAIQGIEKWLHANMIELDGILMHEKPLCGLYIGDETLHPDVLADYAESAGNNLVVDEEGV